MIREVVTSIMIVMILTCIPLCAQEESSFTPLYEGMLDINNLDQNIEYFFQEEEIPVYFKTEIDDEEGIGNDDDPSPIGDGVLLLILGCLIYAGYVSRAVCRKR